MFEILQNEDSSLTDIVQNFVLVGSVDLLRMMLQSDNCLYLVDILPLLEEFFYQRSLRLTGQMNRRRLMLNPEEGGLPLATLVATYLELTPDAALPTHQDFASQSDAIEHFVGRLNKPEILLQLWHEFGVGMEPNEAGGLRIQGILALVDKYYPLMNYQIWRFGYDLVCCDWGAVSYFIV
jgi:hypothetical protein